MAADHYTLRIIVEDENAPVAEARVCDIILDNFDSMAEAVTAAVELAHDHEELTGIQPHRTL